MFDPKTRFLIIDDMSEMRRILRTFLSSLGYHLVIQAAKGEEGLRLMRHQFEIKSPVHVVILDWNLEDMKGTDVLKMIRSTRELKATKVLFVTAETRKEVAEQAAALQVDGFIRKPLSRAVFMAALEGLEKGLPPDWEEFQGRVS